MLQDQDRKAEIVSRVRNEVSMALAEWIKQAFDQGYSIADVNEMLINAKTLTRSK